MARKILISRRDWMQETSACFSGGIWRSNLPLVNLLDIRPQFVAEAVDSRDWESTKFDADLGYVRKVGVIWFANLRASSLGFMRVRAGIDASFGTNVYDSGIVTCRPKDGVAFEDNAWGVWSMSGIYDENEYLALGMPRFFVPSVVIDIRYIRVEIMDNSASQALQIGCFGASEVWESTIDFAPAPQISLIDGSEVNSIPYGSTFVTKRNLRRRFNFGFPALDNSEVLSRTLGLALIKGRSKPLVVVSYPDDTENLEKTSAYGIVSLDGVLSNPFFGAYAQPIQVDQLI